MPLFTFYQWSFYIRSYHNVPPYLELGGPQSRLLCTIQGITQQSKAANTQYMDIASLQRLSKRDQYYSHLYKYDQIVFSVILKRYNAYVMYQT